MKTEAMSDQEPITSQVDGAFTAPVTLKMYLCAGRRRD
jgi:hypothetical protein